MNNDYFKANDDGIGMDPTQVEVIETLNVLPKEAAEDGGKKSKKRVKKGQIPNSSQTKKDDLVKKILFTVVVIALMAGVSYGVYFYLSLGTKNNQSKFSIEDKIVYIGSTLSNSVIEYGDFSTIDITTCDLEKDSVDTSKPGEYTYSVTCGKTKYTAKIIVVEKVIFDLETVIVFKTIGDEVVPEEFFEYENENYQFSFVNEEDVTSYLEDGEGFYSIDIQVTNDKGKTQIISGLLNVFSTEFKMHLTCDGGIKNNSDYSYNITDIITFDDDNLDLKESIRIFNYMYDEEEEYELAKQSIEEGKVDIDGHYGYALIDNVNKKIKVVETLKSEVLDEEYGDSFPETYSEIAKYYRTEKKYSCSL